MKEKIPLSIPNVNHEEKNRLNQCIESTFISSVGPFIEEFEKTMVDYVKTSYGVAMINGTASIHIALLAAGVTKDDYVIVPNITFIATLNPIRYLHASPILMDIDEDDLGLSPSKLQYFLESECYEENGKCFLKADKKRIKAIIPVHIFGTPCKIQDIVKIANNYGIYVIEDAAEALGSFSRGKHCGTFGDIGCFSFNGNKIITSGSGGMLITTHEEIFRKAKHLSTTAKSDTLNFVHDEIGYNYRISNLHAAIGVSQLKKLSSFIKTKKKNYLLYKKLLDKIENVSLFPIPNSSNHWFYSLYISEKARISKDSLMQGLISQGIDVRSIWTPMSELPMYRQSIKSNLKNSCKIFKRIINIPCSSNLNEEQVYRVVEAIKLTLKREIS